MSDKRATIEELNRLHAQVATTLKQALTHAYTNEDGQKVPPPSALINVAVNFLKANGITGAEITPKKITDFLDETSLPFLEQAILDVVDKTAH